jgi:lysophospholipase L1-like esterase
MKVNRFLVVAATLAVATLVSLPIGLQAQAAGGANFTRYVALGDSLTAGFASGGLVTNYQQNSYPALIHRQATGGDGFQQPLVSAPGIPALLGLAALAPGPAITRAPGSGQPLNLNLQRPYDNMAVPGADVLDLVSTTTDNGGMHDLILRRLGFAQLQQGLSLQPTFVTLWIGNNDALGAATSGIVIDQTLTPLPQFEAAYRAAAAAITSVGARFAVANIPDVTSIPFVTTVPRVVNLPSGPFTLHGPDGPLQPGDFVLLTASTLIPQGFGIPTALGGRGPLPDQVVLSAAEVAAIRARVAGYNTVIRSVADQHGAAFFDAAAWLNQAATTGVQIGGVRYTNAFLTGGVFSYDAVHPTDLGYAVIANQFIRAINERFGSAIEPVNLYPFIFGPPAFPTGASPAAVASAEGVVFSEAAWQGLRAIVDADKADKAGSGDKGDKGNRGEAPKPRRHRPRGAA